MKVKVKKIVENAIMPSKTYDEDFCYDVVATSCEEIAPNVYKYGLGLAFQIDRENFNINIPKTKSVNVTDTHGNTYGTQTINERENLNLSLDFRPRSSVWKTGMILSNTVGTIDELYRGQVYAIYYHVLPNMPKYEIGDRIGQIKLGITIPISFEETNELNSTTRGDGGFGSTGK